MPIPLLMFVLGALVSFESNGKWGYKDAGGKVVIPARYAVAMEFSAEGIAAVADQKGWAYIDATGRVLIRPLVVDNGPDYFSEGLARFTKNGKYGFFDRHGKVVILPAHDYASAFSEGRAAVCHACKEVPRGEHRSVEGGRWGFIDANGKLVIPLRFEEAGSFENGRAKVRLEGRWRAIDKQGTLLP